MTKRRRILLTALSIVAIVVVVWITVNVRNGSITFTDETVDIELIPPAAS